MSLATRLNAFSQAIGVDVKDLFARVEAVEAVESTQEVFVGAPDTLPSYTALIFEEAVIDGQVVYAMKVNSP